jgi:hypothetical protein
LWIYTRAESVYSSCVLQLVVLRDKGWCYFILSNGSTLFFSRVTVKVILSVLTRAS